MFGNASLKPNTASRQTGWRTSGLVRFFLFVALALILYASLLGKVVPQTYDIRPNTVSEKTIVAPWQIPNEIATEKAKEEAAARVQPVYRTVSVRNDQLVELLFDKLEMNNADQEMTVEIKANLYRNLFPSEYNDHVDRAVAQLSGKYNDNLLAEMKKQLQEQQYKMAEESFYKLPRLTKEDLAAMEPVTLEIVNKLMNDPITDAQNVRTRVTELVNSSNLAKNTSREMVQELARFAITPNKFLDAKATEEARVQARENTKPVLINKNDVLVNKGEVVTEEIYQRLDKLNLLKDETDYRHHAGLMLLVALLVLVLHQFVRQSKLPLQSNNIQLGMLMLIYVMALLGLRIVSLGQNLEYPFIGFLAPFALGSVLALILLDAQFAFITAVLFSLLAGIVFNLDAERVFDYRYMLVSLVVCFAAIFSVHKASQRTTILRAGIMISLLGCVAVLALSLLDSEWTLKQLSFAFAFSAAGGLVTAVLVIGLLPFFEMLFGILSPLKLVELSHPNLPLLRKLLTEAPGTYHHSVMVGNLAEAAAESVGANGLLCRVGAYYHDVGKTKRPVYFIENQMQMDNPHDQIEPDLSKAIITAHPRDGVEMLSEQKIPKPIRDIAEQHHGTTLLKYFYYKAVKQAEEKGLEPPTEEEYRYPGPKAQSKEAAIVGIADCVEAAVRSLRHPTIEQIDSMVHKIIKDRLDDGQFNECDLTIRELDTIAKALKETLMGIFHARIEYPQELSTKSKEEGKA
ncbi:cyclic-di-AMP phosphodiesterase PgpH [Paenibacillus sp. J31TS4]|uniref:HD family phosphohydrolase n=1 Tax=Paenibacillus sp. J31TS4 TaxID=2807195 RepID=UPI001B03CEDD|nr:HDIG domain-containing metalloprotein [Paenibacillus sp. J31TS4]GIP39614.1 cyclic-di-AMP phosphodiesterase PgpH [Paenibacillus sp. J31TS4]